MKIDREKSLTIAQVAVLLSCSHRHVLNLLSRGHFPHAYKMDPSTRSRFLIPQADVDRFIKLQKVRPFVEKS